MQRATTRVLTRVGFLKRAGRQRLSSLRFAQGQALSAAKDLSPGQAQILRCAQDDTSHLAGSFPKKPTRVRTLVVARCVVARLRLLFYIHILCWQFSSVSPGPPFANKI